MKKGLLLSLVMLLSCAAANASDWRLVDTKTDTVRMYVDMDSIKVNDKQTQYAYAARYSVKGNPEKLVYLKTDTTNDKLGIIRVEDYDDETYRPIRNLSEAHAYMKDVPADYFLKPLNDCILAISKNQTVAEGTNGMYVVKGESVDNNEYETTWSYKLAENKNGESLKEELVSHKGYNENISSSEIVNQYLAETCELLNANWLPTKVTSFTRTIVNAEINKKGKLVSYRIIEPSGDDAIDASVINALEKAQPYGKLPAKDAIYSMKFKFVFDRSPLGKSVVY